MGQLRTPEGERSRAPSALDAERLVAERRAQERLAQARWNLLRAVVPLIMVAAVALAVGGLSLSGASRWAVHLLGALAGVGVLVAALWLTSLSAARRVIWAGGGALLLLAAVDLLDGAQQALPLRVLMVALCGVLFTDSVVALAARGRLGGRGLITTLAALLALGSVGAAILSGGASGPLGEAIQLLSTAGLPLYLVLQHPNGAGRGAGWSCRSCGLPNIPERRVCKRCGAQRGG